MYPATNLNLNKANPVAFRSVASGALLLKKLIAEDEAEVLKFLGERPAHTFGMVGFIRSNGIASPHNRGEFYGCRDQEGNLEGVALIGHYILFETRSDAATEAFARLAQECRRSHMLLGEQDKVEVFWSHYVEGGQAPRLYCRELLFELRRPLEGREPVAGLRLASLNDLDLIVPAHAQTAFDESGIDPLQVDPDGFRERCARRIELGQTWVWVEDGKLVFKADVITDTPQVLYLEGVWVDPQQRGKGLGLRCMSQLSRILLQRTASICLLVNEKFQGAQAFYRSAGYRFIGSYDTIFLRREAH